MAVSYKENMNNNSGSTLKKVIDGMYQASFVVGVLTLPIALFVKDVEGRWVSYLASTIFFILHFLKKKLN
jgi:hypothetical protein